ncbi:Neutral/alkaline non-lysosomal ceramidase [Trifolium repens]|nr:Neutral/alkaline non-lysosomal ceramidase [Trifolium repens]
MFTCVYKNGTRLKVIVSLNNTLFYCIRNSIKGLLHKTKRSYRINYILQITARSSMCMSPTDCYIFFRIQISKPSKD